MTEVESTRKTQRYSVRLPVSVFYGGQIIHGMSQNLSMGGMCIHLEVSASVFPPAEVPGADLTVSFQVPGHPLELVIEGEVRWSDYANGIGIRFARLDAPEKKALGRLFHRAPRIGPAPVTTAAA